MHGYLALFDGESFDRHVRFRDGERENLSKQIRRRKDYCSSAALWNYRPHRSPRLVFDVFGSASFRQYIYAHVAKLILPAVVCTLVVEDLDEMTPSDC